MHPANPAAEKTASGSESVKRFQWLASILQDQGLGGPGLA